MVCKYFHRQLFLSLLNQSLGSILESRNICTQREKNSIVCHGIGLLCSRGCVESTEFTHSSTASTLNDSHWLPWNVFFHSNFLVKHTIVSYEIPILFCTMLSKLEKTQTQTRSCPGPKACSVYQERVIIPINGILGTSHLSPKPPRHPSPSRSSQIKVSGRPHWESINKTCSSAVNANFTEQIIHSGFPTQFPMTLQRAGRGIVKYNVLWRCSILL